MSTFRTGNHWGVTIVREGGRAFLHGADADPPGEHVDGCDWPAGNCWGRDVEHRAHADRLRPGTGFADSCTCTVAGPDPACIVHQGRRAKGPKPPPVGAGCICDGSGRSCPRHGAVT